MGHNQVFSPWSNSSTNSPTILIPDTNKICIELIKDSSNVFYVNFYVSNPDIAAPSKPQNLTISYNQNNNPILRWYRNNEPDLVKYKIYKKSTSELGFQLLAETVDTFCIDLTEQCVTGPPTQMSVMCFTK